MRNLKPICNGCNLEIYGRRVHGDLWANAGGDLFVFVPVLRWERGSKTPYPAWDTPNTDGPLRLIMPSDADIWERNAIFILQRVEAELTPELQAYLDKWEY